MLNLTNITTTTTFILMTVKSTPKAVYRALFFKDFKTFPNKRCYYGIILNTVYNRPTAILNSKLNVDAPQRQTVICQNQTIQPTT